MTYAHSVYTDLKPLQLSLGSSMCMDTYIRQTLCVSVHVQAAVRRFDEKAIGCQRSEFKQKVRLIYLSNLEFGATKRIEFSLNRLFEQLK